ncbi:MAG: undecaprenyldiphospho-muramoylpentapeptide beta-N-acetylglucosaminyltransferase [Chitinophagaceae bacterium]|nr:undecaprenyldiphospho-muramoylpentapeptide beta-N-acetylglucosaminyltransferase [Chitinophagaceae bacterium]
MIIAGGGTGGHIFPAIAIANAVKQLQPSADILFVGAKGKMEMEKVPKEGYQIIGLDIAGYNRDSLIKNALLPFKLIKSFFSAAKIIRNFKPNAVVGVGGYASFPILNAAQQRGIVTLIQEQNSFAGKSNKILGKRATAICVAYDGMERFFPAGKIINTGNPVRQSITKNEVSATAGKSFFRLDNTKKIVFAFGGSLGARSINETLLQQFKEIVAQGAQLIWQTGSGYYAQAAEAVKGYESQVKVFEFIREMDYAYAAADVIIARAGASSISELCIVAKPVIFVPFPFASEDHQTHNAMALVNKKAALLVKDSDTKGELISTLKSLMEDEILCATMSTNLQALAIRDADIRIANKLIEIAG